MILPDTALAFRRNFHRVERPCPPPLVLKTAGAKYRDLRYSNRAGGVETLVVHPCDDFAYRLLDPVDPPSIAKDFLLKEHRNRQLMKP